MSVGSVVKEHLSVYECGRNSKTNYKTEALKTLCCLAILVRNFTEQFSFSSSTVRYYKTTLNYDNIKISGSFGVKIRR